MKKDGMNFFLPSKSKIILFIIIETVWVYSLINSLSCLVSSGLSCNLSQIISLPIFILVMPFLSGSGILALFLGFLVSLIYSYILSSFLVWLVGKIIRK